MSGTEFEDYIDAPYEPTGGPAFPDGMFVDADDDFTAAAGPDGWVTLQTEMGDLDLAEREARIAMGRAHMQAAVAPQHPTQALLRLLQSGDAYLTTFFGNVVANRVALARKKVKDDLSDDFLGGQ